MCSRLPQSCYREGFDWPAGLSLRCGASGDRLLGAENHRHCVPWAAAAGWACTLRCESPRVLGRGVRQLRDTCG